MNDPFGNPLPPGTVRTRHFYLTKGQADALSACLPDWKMLDVFSEALEALPNFGDADVTQRQPEELFNAAFEFCERAVNAIIGLQREAEHLAANERDRYRVLMATLGTLECLIAEVINLTNTKTSYIVPSVDHSPALTGEILSHIDKLFDDINDNTKRD